jgi:hypothetical protein
MYIIHNWWLSFLIHFHLFYSFSWFQFLLGSHGVLVLFLNSNLHFMSCFSWIFFAPRLAFISSLHLNFLESYISRLPFHQMFFLLFIGFDLWQAFISTTIFPNCLEVQILFLIWSLVLICNISKQWMI